MVVRPFAAAAVLCALAALPAQVFAAGCKIGQLAELPVTMDGMRPMVSAKINGKDAPFIVDSGAFFSLIPPAIAAQFNLRTQPAPGNLRLRGFGGTAAVTVTTVNEFTLAGIPLKNVQFLVGGSEPGRGAAGLLGQNVLRIADVEYDLANGAIRLMKPEGCGKTTMVYWASPGQAYSEMEIGSATAASPHTTGIAYLNGEKIKVMFDTGASMSMLSLRAAERAGVKPDGAGVVKAGLSRGLGSGVIQTWIAPFESFRIGDEVIRNTKLRLGEIGNPGADMMIGADFFLSHRVYVASGQRKLYFTYNGGPVFDLRSAPEAAPSSVTASADDSGAPSNVMAGVGNSSTLTNELEAPSNGSAPLPNPGGEDAAAFARRGTAYAARRDFQRAITELTRACELAPTEPAYFFERGRVRVANREPQLAMSDFNRAIELKPDHVDALVARAELRSDPRQGPDPARRAEIIADLDKANAAAAKEADVRLQMGGLYARADALTAAIEQFDLWIAPRPRDARAPDALAQRCRAKGMLGQDLEKALSDCNRAVKARADTPMFLDSRGLVHVRLGNFDKAIADYDAVIRLQPRNAWALYLRGLARLRKGMTAEGEADIAASKAINPRASEDAARRGLAP